MAWGMTSLTCNEIQDCDHTGLPPNTILGFLLSNMGDGITGFKGVDPTLVGSSHKLPCERCNMHRKLTMRSYFWLDRSCLVKAVGPSYCLKLLLHNIWFGDYFHYSHWSSCWALTMVRLVDSFPPLPPPQKGYERSFYLFDWNFVLFYFYFCDIDTTFPLVPG